MMKMMIKRINEDILVLTVVIGYLTRRQARGSLNSPDLSQLGT